MDCSCAIDVYADDCDPVELFKSAMRKAIKKHECISCSRAIVPGEEYEHTSYHFEGKFWQEKTCGDCLSVRRQFYPNGGYCPEVLWEDVEYEVDESLGEIPEACIAELTPVARGKLCDLIERVW